MNCEIGVVRDMTWKDARVGHNKPLCPDHVRSGPTTVPIPQPPLDGLR